jgi:hypothetical protein
VVVVRAPPSIPGQLSMCVCVCVSSLFVAGPTILVDEHIRDVWVLLHRHIRLETL